MCGITGIFGNNWQPEQLTAMLARQHHRGPDYTGQFIDHDHQAGLGHNRLSIIDLSPNARQPIADTNNRYQLIFNGEIYNYLELRRELSDYQFRSQSDSEVLLAAYQKWGQQCLDRLIGMFAFAIWDSQDRSLFAARDRFGVKPLYYHQRPDQTLLLASEIKSIRECLELFNDLSKPDPIAWASYLTNGLYDHSAQTFWQGIISLPPGHLLRWRNGELSIRCWYDLIDRIGFDYDERPIETVISDYQELLIDSVRLRFRADVPVGINLSGGLDSATLLALVQQIQGPQSDVKAFTFITGDQNYDELPWVEQMLAHTRHPLMLAKLTASAVPELAISVQAHQDEPFGGLPTLAYANLFSKAREQGVIVLLDGQGLDEQWAGYDYYREPQSSSIVQGTRERLTRPEALSAEFRALAQPFEPPKPFPDRLRNLQYRDLRYTKIPRALRFNDRVSMRASTELREPFLDHRLVELAFRQRAEWKIAEGTGKWLLRQLSKKLLPATVVEAPKRALQTPQREWLRGPLQQWATEQIEEAIKLAPNWLQEQVIRSSWQRYCDGEGDNSFFIWQWISISLIAQTTGIAYE